MRSVFATLDKLKPAYDVVYRITMLLCKLLLVVDILVTSLAVAGRFVSFIPDPAWSEEVVLTCMVYMALISASMALRRNAHIRMTAFDGVLPKKLLLALDILADAAVLIFAVIMLTQGAAFVLNSKGYYTSMPFLPKSVMFAGVPVAGVFMIVFEIENLYNHIKACVIGKEAA